MCARIQKPAFETKAGTGVYKPIPHQSNHRLIGERCQWYLSHDGKNWFFELTYSNMIIFLVAA